MFVNKEVLFIEAYFMTKQDILHRGIWDIPLFYLTPEGVVKEIEGDEGPYDTIYFEIAYCSPALVAEIDHYQLGTILNLDMRPVFDNLPINEGWVYNSPLAFPKVGHLLFERTNDVEDYTPAHVGSDAKFVLVGIFDKEFNVMPYSENETT